GRAPRPSTSLVRTAAGSGPGGAEHCRERSAVEGGPCADDLAVPALVPLGHQGSRRGGSGRLQLEEDDRLVPLPDQDLDLELGHDLQKLPEGPEIRVGAGIGLEEADERHVVGEAGARCREVPAEDGVVEARQDRSRLVGRAGGAHVQVSRARPVSRNDLRLENTRGQPSWIFLAISEPPASSSSTTVSRTFFPPCSTVNVTREWPVRSLPADGSDQVSIRRSGGTDSTTSPAIRTFRASSAVTCCQRLPRFQSERFSWPQYWR